MLQRLKNLSLNMVRTYKRSYSSGCSPCVPVVPCTKISVLSTGMRVATEESGSPLACVSLFVEVGPTFEKPSNYGMTHFIEHMAFTGFKSMSKAQLEEYLSSIGAKTAVLTTREFQMFSVQGPAECVSDFVNILSKIVTDLDVSQPELDMAKCMIDLECEDANNNPKITVFDYLHESAFQCTPLSQRIIGPSKNIERFDKSAIQCFIKEHYYPRKFVLATSGAVNHDNLVSIAQTCFGNIDPTCGVSNCPPQRFTGSQIAHRDDSIPLAHIAIAVETCGYTGSDYYMLLLASNIMGSWNKCQGGSNRHGLPLARAAATSNLCESFESFYIPYRDVGLWGIYIVADKMNIDDMIMNAQNYWMNLCTTTVITDVERGINATKLELANRIQGSIKSCYELGVQVFYNCSRRSLSQYYGILERASEKNIKQVATNYIYDKCPVVAAVGPVEGLPDYTRTRAGMYWLRL